MKKIFCFKAINESFNYIEIKIPSKSYEKAEKNAIKFCNKTNLTPIEYVGWEEQL